MRKILSVLVALCLVFSLSATVFAGTINIQGEAGDNYKGYKLFDLTTSLKTGAHHPASCDNINHSDDCYNYAYSVGAKYREILQKEVYDNAGSTFWAGGKPSEANKVTDSQILDYVESLTSDSGSEYGSLRSVADRIYRAIKAASTIQDATFVAGNNTADQGYWLIADVTNNSGANKANSIVMLDTKGQSDITITPKTGLPQLEKKVKDIEDTEDDKIADNPWMDSADFDIGDKVPFKLTGTLPNNARVYKSFKMAFHDTLSSGLTIDADSIKVLMYETKHKADVDTDMNDSMKDVTASFTKKTSGLTDGCSFEVYCDNVYTIEGVTKDTAFVVYYEATLNDGVAIGAAGNPNEAYLEYSNDPYGDGTGKTNNDKVVVFTYKVVVNKTDSHGHELEGAGFTLYKKYLSGEYKVIGTELKGPDMTTFEWKGLDDGDYKLVESTVPSGYNKMSDIEFSISAAHSEHADEPELTSLDGGLMGTGVVSTGTITKDIENHTGIVLPQTGAKGTMLLMLFSAMLVCGAAVFMVARKKMSVYED